MRDLFTMWRNTRMVVLTAICASIYAAILIPFKVIPLIPGVTEFRPANALMILGLAQPWGMKIFRVDSQGIERRRENFLTPPKEYINDLDILPFPAWDLSPPFGRRPKTDKDLSGVSHKNV